MTNLRTTLGISCGLTAFAHAAWGASAPKANEGTVTFPHYSINVTGPGKNPFPLNAHTSLTVSLEPRPGVDAAAAGPLDLAFDARMPEHKHGMVVKPRVTKLGPTEFRVDGVRFHMPGKWVLEFKIRDAAGETLVISPITIK